MTDGLITPKESARFLQAVQALPELTVGELDQLNVAMPNGTLAEAKPGIF